MTRPGRGGLGHDRRMPVDELPERGHRPGQRRRRDGEPEPQLRREHLGERTDVDDPPAVVEPVDRLERAVHMTELAVSPGSSTTRATRAAACCPPEATTTRSASAA